jgi:hypothetical protein
MTSRETSSHHSGADASRRRPDRHQLVGMWRVYDRTGALPTDGELAGLVLSLDSFLAGLALDEEPQSS